ncbi:transketolase [Candidatus Soleaferrea massiliensis]|uniref:transketolase n=1 Tax=Candidatus Soleaferrea massiliensis TaxID=1470354 RepID=UPI00058C5B5D|nr:transketolase [Candidatus Soleaferrea massiliensis]
MNDSLKRELELTAGKIRLHAVDAIYHAKSGHPGGSLSIADILAYLYFVEMHVDPKNPKWEDRDRLVLSKGHAAPALYAALALKGFFPVSELKNLRKPGCMLQGHPDMKGTPGIDMSTGSLGQGISAACGIALAGKLDNKGYRVYAVLGDGELQEGQVWEAAMFAAHRKLDNLCIFVDNNGLQIDGKVCEVCSPHPITDKFAAFGFETLTIDAHSFDEIEHALQHARSVKGKPTAIIANSTKGKGVSYMEHNVSWHGAAPNKDQHAVAMSEFERFNGEEQSYV